jgi:toxin FitB
VNGWLLDTNVISELRRPRPAPQVAAFVAEKPLERLYVSAVAFAEIRFGIERAEEPERRAQLHDWLTLRVRPMFEGRVLEVSEDVMFKWRLLVEEGRKVWHTFSQPDLIIAATALHHGLVVVTRNTGDFIRSGAMVVDPWG